MTDDRTPPHDIDAEKIALGSMLISEHAAERVSSIVSAGDFYRPAHQAIFTAIAKTRAQHGQTNAVLVGEHLHGLGELVRCGGGPYLHGLVEAVPAASNGPWFADKVRSFAVRRRLISAGLSISQSGYEMDAENPVQEVTGIVQHAIEDLEAVRDFEVGGELTTLTIDEFLAVEEPDYDWIVPGLLERGDRMILTGMEGLGKALALDTPIPTPKGWSTMGALSVGDEVFGPDGKPARVIAATDTMTGRPCYRMGFSDGSTIVADGQHMWLTETLRARETASKYATKDGTLKARGTDQRHKRAHFPQVVTTTEIAETLTARGGHAVNHSINVSAPLEYPDQELPIDPYAFGAWLGDGNSRMAMITCHTDDREILDRIAETGWPIRERPGSCAWAIGDGKGKGVRGAGTFAGRLRMLGVLRNKHIPETYLRSSIEQRLALLQGLMDTDGTIGTGPAPICEFSVCSERLAFDVLDLLQGLGVKVRMRSGDAVLGGRAVGTRWRLAFQTDLPVFHLKRKAERLAPLRTRRSKLRYITAVEPIDSVPVRCIQVDRTDGMFLAGRSCIPTHNSMLLRQVAVTIAAGVHPFKHTPITPKRVLLVDAENSDTQTRRKIRPIVTQARLQGHPVAEDKLWVEPGVGAMDLSKDRTMSWLLQRVALIRPDVLVIGPLYQLAPRALQTDDETAPILAALNLIRDRGVCLLMEAHAGHAHGVGGKRDLRPRGSASLMGWPEFGYGVRHSEAPAVNGGRRVELVSWRGDRDERDWPEELESGGAWPWSQALPPGVTPGMNPHARPA